jgi:hypothetical protein
MDVVYAFPFQVVRKPKSLDEWRDLWVDAELRLRWLDAIESAASGSFRG